MNTKDLHSLKTLLETHGFTQVISQVASIAKDTESVLRKTSDGNLRCSVEHLFYLVVEAYQASKGKKFRQRVEQCIATLHVQESLRILNWGSPSHTPLMQAGYKLFGPPPVEPAPIVEVVEQPKQELFWISSEGKRRFPYSGKKPKKVWTLFASEPTLPIEPRHNENAFFEEWLHDWDLINGEFQYYSRIVCDKVWVLFEH